MFWSASAISSLGDGMLLIGFPLLAASLTRSPLWIAAVVFVQRLPAWIMAIPIGAVVDRRDPRRTAIAMNVAQAVLFTGVGVLIGLGHFPLAALMAAAFVTEAFGTVFTCAAGGLLADIVEPEQFGLANARLRSALAVTGLFAGPGLGGLLFASGHQWPVIVDAATFAGAAAMLAAIRLPSKDDEPAARAPLPLVQEIKDGLRITFREPGVRLIAATLATLAGFQAGSIAIFVLFGTEDLKLGKTAFGVTLALGNSLAPIVVLLVPKVAALRASKAILGAIAAACVGEFVLGTATTQAQAIVGLALDSVGSVAMLTARMRLVPREMLGRMTGAFQTILYGSVALGALLGGLTAHVSLRAPYLLCGAACLVLLIVVGPRLRILDPDAATGAEEAREAAGEAVRPLGTPEPADHS